MNNAQILKPLFICKLKMDIPNVRSGHYLFELHTSSKVYINLEDSQQRVNYDRMYSDLPVWDTSIWIT